jgi:hypothetical protein
MFLLLESIPNKWMNQSQGWKKSGELILYDVIENSAQRYTVKHNLG